MSEAGGKLTHSGQVGRGTRDTSSNNEHNSWSPLTLQLRLKLQLTYSAVTCACLCAKTFERPKYRNFEKLYLIAKMDERVDLKGVDSCFIV